MQKIKIILLSLSILIGTALTVGQARPAFALLGIPGAKGAACQGLNLSASSSGCDQTELNAASSSVDNTIASVVNILSIVVGVAAVVTIIVSGLRYITSQGDANSVASAQKAIIYALVGIVIVAFAQIIVKFVLGKVKL